MLRFPRVIPSPFYTGWCLYIGAGTQPAARHIPTWCHGHRRCMVLPMSYGRAGFPPHTAASDGRDVGLNDREVEKRPGDHAISGNSRVFVYRPQSPCFVYPRTTPAPWYLGCQSRFSAIRSHFHLHRLIRGTFCRCIRSNKYSKAQRSRAFAQALTASPDNLMENKCRGTATQNRRGRCCNVGSGGIV